MGKRMRRIVNILICKESTAAKGEVKHAKRDGSVRKRAVAQLIDKAVDTGQQQQQQNNTIETSKSAEDIYHEIKVSIDSLREKVERHNKSLTDAILSHCLITDSVETNTAATATKDIAEEVNATKQNCEKPKIQVDEEVTNMVNKEASEPDISGDIAPSEAPPEAPPEVPPEEEFEKHVHTGTESLDRSTDEKQESGDMFKPKPLKEMTKLILISMVYKTLLADKLAKRHANSTLQCGRDALAEPAVPGLNTSLRSDTDDSFVFGPDAKIYDILSRNNNHPGADDDCEPEIHVKISFFDGSPSQSGKRPSSSSVHRSSKTFKDYYLFPIGSFSATSPMTKWKDVTSIIPAGVPHRNVDDKKFGIFEKQMSTISQGVPTSSYTKAKAYAVRKLRPPIAYMEPLLEQNAHTRIFQETHAKFVCVNLMMALRFLHEHDIAHGSLCPRKIILNDKGYPCLTGFETAEVIDDRPSRPRGKIDLEYSASEQIYQDCISEVTDTYSLGVLTYHMIYGKPPHRGKTPVDTRRNALNKDFKARFSPEPISPEGRRLISKCIRKYEDRRFDILDKKHGLIEGVSWFSGLNEDKLYKQTVPSPLLPLMSNQAPPTE